MRRWEVGTGEPSERDPILSREEGKDQRPVFHIMLHMCITQMCRWYTRMHTSTQRPKHNGSTVSCWHRGNTWDPSHWDEVPVSMLSPRLLFTPLFIRSYGCRRKNMLGPHKSGKRNECSGFGPWIASTLTFPWTCGFNFNFKDELND